MSEPILQTLLRSWITSLQDEIYNIDPKISKEFDKTVPFTFFSDGESLGKSYHNDILRGIYRIVIEMEDLICRLKIERQS